MTQIQGSSDYWSPLHFQRATGAVETAGPMEIRSSVAFGGFFLMIPTGPWNASGVHTVPTASTTEDLIFSLKLEISKTPNTTFTLLPAIEAAQQKEWAEKDAKIAAKREREDAMGKAEFVRSLDPKSSKEQTWNERELGQKWKKNNWSEAWQIERAAEASRPKQEPGLERDSGWRWR